MSVWVQRMGVSFRFEVPRYNAHRPQGPVEPHRLAVCACTSIQRPRDRTPAETVRIVTDAPDAILSALRSLADLRSFLLRLLCRRSISNRSHVRHETRAHHDVSVEAKNFNSSAARWSSATFRGA